MAALDAYGLDDPNLTFHAFETNLLYRVTTRSGERFMMRLAVPKWRTLRDLQSEAMWLDALDQETNLTVPRVVRTRSGQQVYEAAIATVPDPWNVTLMTWVPGKLLGNYLTTENLEKMGRLFAELHRHGRNWERPQRFTTRRFEHWLSRGEPNVLVGEDRMASVSKAGRQLIARMHEHVEGAYAAVDSSDLRVIHCDLWHGNIKLHQGGLNPFDFEDTVLGYRAHDIAMAMLDLLEDTDDDTYARLFDAFHSGYEATLTWPTNRIEPFQVGRLLWRLNWIGRHQKARFDDALRKYVPVLTQYEKTGRLHDLPN